MVWSGLVGLRPCVAICFEMQQGAGDELHHAVVKVVRRKLPVAILPANQASASVAGSGWSHCRAEFRFRFIAK